MRLFVALDLPPAQREALARFRGTMPGVQWTAAESYHLTLRFIGQVTSRHMLEEIDLSLSRLAWSPFALSLLGADLREGMANDSLTIGVERSDALNALQTQVDSALRRAGVAAARRKFQPGVTIGHLSVSQRPDAARWVQSHNLFRSAPMAVQHVTLFESVRSGGEPVYVPRAEYAWHPHMPLGDDDDDGDDDD